MENSEIIGLYVGGGVSIGILFLLLYHVFSKTYLLAYQNITPKTKKIWKWGMVGLFLCLAVFCFVYAATASKQEQPIVCKTKLTTDGDTVCIGTTFNKDACGGSYEMVVDYTAPTSGSYTFSTCETEGLLAFGNNTCAQNCSSRQRAILTGTSIVVNLNSNQIFNFRVLSKIENTVVQVAIVKPAPPSPPPATPAPNPPPVTPTEGSNGTFFNFITEKGYNITYFIPDHELTSVTCMASLGGSINTTNNNSCAWNGAYKPFQYEHAYSTNYCLLETGGCSGAVGDPRPTIEAARSALLNSSTPGVQSPPWGPIDNNTVFGVTATPPIMNGNSGEGISLVTGQAVTSSFQGLTEVSGLCYDVIGPGGGRAILIVGDRCAGYCGTTCSNETVYNTPADPGTSAYAECGHCVTNPNNVVKPGPPCVGTVKGPVQTDMYANCSGNEIYECLPVFAECDWCASNNHPHFDLDNTAYTEVCTYNNSNPAGDPGSCELHKVMPFKCIPNPQPMSAGGAGYNSGCVAQSYSNGETPCTQFFSQYNSSIPGQGYCCCQYNIIYNTTSGLCGIPGKTGNVNCPEGYVALKNSTDCTLGQNKCLWGIVPSKVDNSFCGRPDLAATQAMCLSLSNAIWCGPS